MMWRDYWKSLQTKKSMKNEKWHTTVTHTHTHNTLGSYFEVIDNIDNIQYNIHNACKIEPIQ